MRAQLTPIRLLTVVLLLVAGCGGDGGQDLSATTTAPADLTAEACLVRVHGRSETGALPVERGSFVELQPIGNAVAGGGHMWLYDEPDDRADALERITAAVDGAGCERVVLNGFSNGGGLIGALVCDGEDLDGRLVGAVIDDPVPDEGTRECSLAPGVEVAVYWTGALTEATAGTSCESLGWVCTGTTIVGIDAYARGLGVDVTTSPMDGHVWFRDAPELEAWLADPT